MENKFINRRKLLQTLSLGGLAGSLVAYQNCSNVGFNAVDSASGSSSTPFDPETNLPQPPLPPGACNRAKNLFDVPASAPVANASLTTLNGKPLVMTAAPAGHNPNARFYQVTHYDHASKSEKVQHLLTVDAMNVTGSSNFTNLNFISDIYVYRQDTAELLYWKRLGDKDLLPSAMVMLDPALVSAGRKLVAVVYSEMQGYYGQLVDLAQAPLDYAGAVANFVSGAAYGGSTVHRPYVSVAATGGQGNIGSLHAPHFHTVTDTEVQVTLGPKSGKHGRYGEDHYMAGALLFDQNGNWLAFSEMTYAMSSNHNFVFTGLALNARKVSHLRVVVLDTLNGVLQGFAKVA